MTTETVEPHVRARLFGSEVIIPNKSKFQAKLLRLINDGQDKLSILTDFDFTLSKFWINGYRGCSCHKVLEDCGLLSEKYHEKAQEVQNKYYPLEIDPTLEEATRIKYMIEWVHQSNELMIEYGLTREIVQQAVSEAISSNKLQLRKHVIEFFKHLHNNHLPVLIFSAGIADIVEDTLQALLSAEELKEVYVISNRCIFKTDETADRAGKHPLIGFEEPVIHVFNKRSSAFMNTPYFQRPDSQGRQNALLFGDSLGDVLMADALENHSGAGVVLKVGFLNDRVEDRLEAYCQVYDVVILGDPAFDVPLGLLSLITSSVHSNDQSPLQNLSLPLELSDHSPDHAPSPSVDT